MRLATADVAPLAFGQLTIVNADFELPDVGMDARAAPYLAAPRIAMRASSLAPRRAAGATGTGVDPTG